MSRMPNGISIHERVFLTIFLIVITGISVINAQTIYTKFGKNRVQYHDDFKDWWSYDTDHYTVYWYGKERNVAKTAMLLSQVSYDDIEEILDYKMNKKINLVIYSSLSELKQSNLGLREENDYKSPGISKFYENKVMVYFNGDHNDLLRQIRQGTAEVFLNNIFSGLSYENVYKKLIYSNFPKWFTSGNISFLADKWNIDDDNRLRQYFQAFDNKKLIFKKLSEKEPELAGKSFLYFFEKKYGSRALSDFFYTVRVSRDIEASFQSASGQNFAVIQEQWKAYFHSQYTTEKIAWGKKEAEKKQKISEKNVDTKFTSLSSDKKGDKICYAENKNGSIVLYLKNKSVTKKVMKYGYSDSGEISDQNYPICFFDDYGFFLYIIFEKRNKQLLRIYNTADLKYEQYIISPEHRKIFSAAYIEKDKLMLSSDIDGFNDLFTYNFNKKQTTRLTEDFWDDLDAEIANYRGNKGIVFSSNRGNKTEKKQMLDTILPTGKYDIYFYNLTDNSIINLTNTPEVNERHASILNDTLIYLTDECGIRNIKSKYSADKDVYLTNCRFGVSDFSINRQSLIYHTENISGNTLYRTNASDKAIADLPKTMFLTNINHSDTSGNKIANTISENQVFEIDSGLMFQSKFKDNTPVQNFQFDKKGSIASNKNFQNKLSPFESYKAVASRLRFSFSEIITQVDNEVLFEGMENYSSGNNSINSTPSGFLAKVVVKDMFEDHFLDVGLRISTDFSQKEYFTVYENLKSRVDWQFAFYRKSRSEYLFERINIIDKIKYLTNMVQVMAKYPFDNFRAFKLTAKIQSDRTIFAASDTISLNQKDIKEQRISLRAEYVFDNTSQFGINLLEGNRSKIFIETYNKFNFDFDDLSKFDISKALMTVVGFDTRQYFRVLNKSVLAMRFAGQKSFGDESNLYFLGGMENWYFSKQSDLVAFPTEDVYAYKVLVANMRGFGYNARNGNSFLVFNSEIRFPIFQYIFGDNIKKKFVRDFQLTLFYDMGLAWFGSTPFSESNFSNYKTIDVPPSIKLRIRYYSDPLLAGMGTGLRTSLFGYFVKLDYAWGIETRKIMKPTLFFSVGYDF
jgi:hypothetical protein